MKNSRLLLIAVSVFWLLVFSAMLAFSPDRRSGGGSGSIVPIGSLLIAAASIVGVIASFRYAKQLNRNPLSWAIGTLLMPYAVPLILAFMKPLGPTELLKHVRSEDVTRMLTDVFVDQAVCSRCRSNIKLQDLKGKPLVCEKCGGKLLRFYAAAEKPKCEKCGARLAEEPVTANTVFGDLINGKRKGFKCGSCGEVTCFNCAPRSGADMTYVCHCGGDLAIQI